MKKTILITSLFSLLVLLLPITAFAFTVKTGSSVYLPPDQSIEGNLYAAGSNITIDGKITGDLFCAGQSITINGEIEGDVICAGQTINLNGQINGSARLAASAINLNGKINRNAMVFASSLILTEQAEINWEMLLAAATADIRGKIGRDLYGSSAHTVISGEIAKNVNLKLDDQKNKNISALTIAKTAKIAGDLSYTANQPATIESGAAIGGQTIHHSPSLVAKEKNYTNYLLTKIFWLFAALVIGLVLISLWREEIKKITDRMLESVNVCFGWGIVVMFLTPILTILLVLTIIGLPLALILIMLWLILLYLSKILVGILIGRSLIDNFWPKQKDSLIWAMILGLIIIYLLTSLPLVGWLLSLLAICWGLGGIFIYFKKV